MLNFCYFKTWFDFGNTCDFITWCYEILNSRKSLFFLHRLQFGRIIVISVTVQARHFKVFLETVMGSKGAASSHFAWVLASFRSDSRKYKTAKHI